MVTMKALLSQRKSLILILVKQTLNFVWLHIANSYLFVNGKEILKFKADNKNVKFPTQFCLESTSNGHDVTESREVSLKGSVYDFSVDYNFIDKSDILNIHKYILTKHNTK